VRRFSRTETTRRAGPGERKAQGIPNEYQKMNQKKILVAAVINFYFIVMIFCEP
jgi:hypothetical protein